MNYHEIVPSQELCVELENRDICQDGIELWLEPLSIGSANQGNVVSSLMAIDGYIPAPHVGAMLREIPDFALITRVGSLYRATSPGIEVRDARFSCLLAKFLIALTDRRLL